MPFWIVLFICVVVAYFAVTEGAKKYFDMKLQVLFNLGLYQDCIDLLDRKLARIVMSTYINMRAAGTRAKHVDIATLKSSLETLTDLPR